MHHPGSPILPHRDLSAALPALALATTSQPPTVAGQECTAAHPVLPPHPTLVLEDVLPQTRFPLPCLQAL